MSAFYSIVSTEVIIEKRKAFEVSFPLPFFNSIENKAEYAGAWLQSQPPRLSRGNPSPSSSSWPVWAIQWGHLLKTRNKLQTIIYRIHFMQAPHEEGTVKQTLNGDVKQTKTQ